MTCGPGAARAPRPGRFFLPAYVGPRGWVALRLDVGEIDWAEIADLATDSYLLTAPKRLGASVAEPGHDARPRPPPAGGGGPPVRSRPSGEAPG